MAQQQGDEMEYAADDNEMAEVEDDMYFSGRVFGDSESESDDDDEYDSMENRMTDTSAAEARKGKDIQGIPWDRLSISREKYRQTRLEQYKNYENIPHSGERSEKECTPTHRGGKYYDFWQNTRSVKSTILHFQLRNLVWATSKHDVYLVSSYSIIHWSSLNSKRSEILNVSGHVAPCEKHPGSLLEGFTQTQISTLAVRDKLLIAGGFQGELICKYVDRPGVSFCSRTTYDDNAITNAVEIYDHPSGAVHFMASNNDCGVRDFDMERFQLSKHFSFSWPVNHTSLSPDGKLVVIVGDNPEGILVDSQTGKVVYSVDLCYKFHRYCLQTKHAVFGMLGTCQNLLLCLRATLELYVLYGLHLMDGSWQWLSQLTLCISMMHRVGLRKSRRSIFLGRSLVYLLALTQNHFSLVSGIAPMEAFFSTIDGETICILTACKFVIAYLVFVKYLQFMFFCLGI
ncbi:putative WD repeat-containing protein C2A9.03 isoform F [Glycine soja]|uniref:Putative WD repeat-containing protein C2A9.03 isoform F n=1 Tax=Glycine soja TaxID=3848 RepID=A0A445K2P9_GLYSO|nr:putative WD repeat-containing protein C2A9.03 isoform F [Glycine soja]